MYSALKRGIIIGVIIMAVGTILMWTIPEQLIAMFGGTQDIMDIGVPAFRIISLCFIPAACWHYLYNTFSGSRKGTAQSYYVILSSACTHSSDCVGAFYGV